MGQGKPHIVVDGKVYVAQGTGQGGVEGGGGALLLLTFLFMIFIVAIFYWQVYLPTVPSKPPQEDNSFSDVSRSEKIEYITMSWFAEECGGKDNFWRENVVSHDGNLTVYDVECKDGTTHRRTVSKSDFPEDPERLEAMYIWELAKYI